MRYAMIDPNLKERNIVNIVEWEGRPFLPPYGMHLIPCEFANTGDTYDFEKKEFIRHYI